MFKNLLRTFLQDNQCRANTIITLSLNSILWLAILIKTGLRNRPLPLHFNAFYGIEQVGPGLLLFIIPAAGLLIFFINLWLAGKIANYDVYLVRILAYATTAVHLLLIGAISTLFIVSS